MLQEAVRDVLVRIDTSIAAQPDFDCKTSDREFTLSISDYTMAMLMPHALAIAAQQRSQVRFKMLQQTSSPARSLERGETDLLIIPSSYCSSDHATDILFEEDFVGVVWNQSTHARRELTLERYTSAGHVIMQPLQTDQLAFENRYALQFGLSRRIALTTFSFTSLPFLVVGTELIATMHTRLARRLQSSLPISLLPVPIPLPKLEQAMQWHKYLTLDPGLMWLRQLMVDAARALVAEDPSA
jgi:DNA-binding transcriptional LysR family regulator